MYIFRHHTAVDIIDLDDRTGNWVPVDEDDDNPIMVGQMSMAQRADFSIRGSYTIENEKRCCFYWNDQDELIFRTPDDRRLSFFRREADGHLTELKPDSQIELLPATYSDGRSIPNMSTFRLVESSMPLFEITYDSEFYLQAYLGNFTFAPDEDLSDWDFFVAVKSAIEELALIARSVSQKPTAPLKVEINEEILVAETGAPCPRTGLWVPATRLDIRCTINQGAPVPDIEGRAGAWVWVGPRR